MSARGGNRGKPAVDVKIDARLSAQRRAARHLQVHAELVGNDGPHSPQGPQVALEPARPRSHVQDHAELGQLDLAEAHRYDDVRRGAAHMLDLSRVQP